MESPVNTEIFTFLIHQMLLSKETYIFLEKTGLDSPWSNSRSRGLLADRMMKSLWQDWHLNLVPETQYPNWLIHTWMESEGKLHFLWPL